MKNEMTLKEIVRDYLDKYQDKSSKRTALVRNSAQS